MPLMNQGSMWPTRKIAAVIISGAVVGAVQSALGLFWPDHSLHALLADIDIWVQAGVMAAFGYFVRERSE